MYTEDHPRAQANSPKVEAERIMDPLHPGVELNIGESIEKENWKN